MEVTLVLGSASVAVVPGLGPVAWIWLCILAVILVVECFFFFFFFLIVPTIDQVWELKSSSLRLQIKLSLRLTYRPLNDSVGSQSLNHQAQSVVTDWSLNNAWSLVVVPYIAWFLKKINYDHLLRYLTIHCAYKYAFWSAVFRIFKWFIELLNFPDSNICALSILVDWWLISASEGW